MDNAEEKQLNRAGYTALYARYNIQAPKLRHESWIGSSRHVEQTGTDGRVVEVFPSSTKQPESDIEHLVFALKRDGVDLLALDRIFHHLDPDELTAAIKARPTSTYLRRLWIFYERLSDCELDVEDARMGNYVDALEPELYVVRDNGLNFRRYRVRWNLLGVPGWCPIVRKTDAIKHWQAADLHLLAQESVGQVPPEVLTRAVRWLIAKETIASFDIERETPTVRAQKFVDTLLTGPSRQHIFWYEKEFAEVQANLIDERFVDSGWRETETFVVQIANLSGAAEIVHHVGARARDVPGLMSCFGDAWFRHQLVRLDRPKGGAIAIGDDAFAFRMANPDPFLDLTMAACLSFSFVFIHPFTDGNGRIHRLLLSHILRTTGHSPPQMPLPIAAAMAADQRGYDDALQDFSLRILSHVDYDADAEEIKNETAHLYAYPDMTAQVEAVCRWYSESVTDGLAREVDTLRRFDAAVENVRTVLQLPNKLERLFVRLCYHNGTRGQGYKIGKNKRAKHFDMLTDQEVEALQDAVSQAFESEERPG